MRTYGLSNKRARLIDGLVKEGIFPSPIDALNGAVDNYLKGLRPQKANAVIDTRLADDGAYKTQEQWIDFFNAQGKPMISAADVYRAGKSRSNEALLKSLKGDFELSLLVTSTVVSYSDSDLSGSFTQNYGSEFVNPSREDVLVIPAYDKTSLVQALQSEEGIAYLQALFGTKDNPKIIATTLRRLSGAGLDQIILWTPDQDSRNGYPERTVRFYIEQGMFNVFGSDRPDITVAHSRGMLVSPRSKHVRK